LRVRAGWTEIDVERILEACASGQEGDGNDRYR